MQATEEEMEHFREVAEMKEIPFNACPPESRTKMNRVSKPGSEALLQEVMARYQKCWEDADVNKDGFLNEAEFCVYNKLMCGASGEIYGWTPGYDEAAVKQIYHAIVSFTPHDDKGVNMASMAPFKKVAYTVRREYEDAGKWIPGYEK